MRIQDNYNQNSRLTLASEGIWVNENCFLFPIQSIGQKRWFLCRNKDFMLASGHNTLQRKEKSSEVKLRIHYFYFTPIRLDKGKHISAEDIQLVYWNFAYFFHSKNAQKSGNFYLIVLREGSMTCAYPYRIHK